VSDLTAGTIRRWVRSGIGTYEACVQEGMTGSEAVNASAWSAWVAVDGDAQVADRIVRSGIAAYLDALEDGILADDAKQSAVAIMSDAVLGEQMARRLRQNVEVDGRVYWQSPEVTILKADAVDLVSRLVESLAVAGSEFSFVFEGYVSPKAGEDGTES
jgi:hypothetical protein